MASPTVVARTQALVSSTTNASSWTPLSGVTVVRGEMLLFVCSADGNPTLSTTSTGWSKLDQGTNGTAVTGAIFVCYPDDNTSTTTTLVINSTASEQYSGVFYRLRGCDSIDFGTNANNSSTNSDPPSNTLPVSARDILSIATRSGDSTTVASAAPSGYGSLQTSTAGGTNGASTNAAELAFSATSTENPGTFTSGNEQWVSYTLLFYQSDALADGHTIANNANTTVTYRGGSVYEIEKTSGSAATYDASAVSSVGIAGDFVLRIRNLVGTSNWIAGVTSDPLSNDSYDTIDHGWLRVADPALGIYENAAVPVAGLTDNIAWIWRTGSTLGYGRGANLATAQASPDRTVTDSASLYFDSSFTNTGLRIEALLYDIPVVDHTTTGSLVGAGSTVSGASAHNKPHPSTGALTGQGSTIVGSAAHIAKHATSGALTGQGSALSGTAARTRQHAATGALIGAGSTVVGSAARLRAFAATGALTGQGSALDGASARFRAFATSGVLIGAGSTIAGDAELVAPAVSHDTSGALVGPSSLIDGATVRFRSFATSGMLVGQGSNLAGTAFHSALHAATGVLAGQGSLIAGEAIYTDRFLQVRRRRQRRGKDYIDRHPAHT